MMFAVHAGLELEFGELIGGLMHSVPLQNLEPAAEASQDLTASSRCIWLRSPWIAATLMPF